MKTFVVFLLLALWLGYSAVAETINFDDAKTSAAPKGWRTGVTGPGKSNWRVVADDSAPSKPNVLKQSGVGKFPWCVKKGTAIKDGYVEVKIKPLAGKEDQACGLIWRWQNGNNYYVARANALEDNVTIYHTIKGVRKECGRTPMKVAANQWHTLRVDFVGQHFTVTFDGVKAIEWDDETFKKAGAVGVWTKADSVTEFDDFTYEAR